MLLFHASPNDLCFDCKSTLNQVDVLSCCSHGLIWLAVLGMCLPEPAHVPCPQGNHYQFDTMRRAKHSSMMVLYHLHNPQAPAFTSVCNMCNAEMEPGTGFRCTVCTDYDVCLNCKTNRGHEHPHPLVVSGCRCTVVSM